MNLTSDYKYLWENYIYKNSSTTYLIVKYDLYFKVICLALCITVTFKETDDLFNDLQRRMDSLRSDIYKDYTPKIRVSALPFWVKDECVCKLPLHEVYFEDKDYQTPSTVAHCRRVRVFSFFFSLMNLSSFSSKEFPVLLEWILLPDLAYSGWFTMHYKTIMPLPSLHINTIWGTYFFPLCAQLCFLY